MSGAAQGGSGARTISDEVWKAGQDFEGCTEATFSGDATSTAATCKVCWKMPPQCVACHEAYTCEEVFDVGGVPGKGYMELHKMGLLNEYGEVI